MNERFKNVFLTFPGRFFLDIFLDARFFDLGLLDGRVFDLRDPVFSVTVAFFFLGAMSIGIDEL